MIFHRRRRQYRSIPQFADENQLAYVLIEEARLRCERVRAPSQPTHQSSLLATLYRELGLAGYSCSEDIDTASRELLLEQARRRAAQQKPHATDDLTLLLAITSGACRALGSPPRDHDSVAHVHVALMHLLCAAELLELLITRPQSTAESRARRR